MSSKSEPYDEPGFLSRFNPLRAGKRRRSARQPLPAQHILLSRWQVERLRRTHEDLLASERYGPACRFFLSDIYAPRDFSQRNQDLTQIYNSMGSVLPARVTETLALLSDLNVLTTELDSRLLHLLIDELGMSDTLSEDTYAEGYRLCDNRRERERQIDLIVALGREVDWLVGRPLIGAALRLAGGPARLTGWSELHDFLERGYVAFKAMGGADTFLTLIEQRERQILRQLFAGAASPFVI